MYILIFVLQNLHVFKQIRQVDTAKSVVFQFLVHVLFELNQGDLQILIVSHHICNLN
jgi:hypothetical protein